MHRQIIVSGIKRSALSVYILNKTASRHSTQTNDDEPSSDTEGAGASRGYNQASPDAGWLLRVHHASCTHPPHHNTSPPEKSTIAAAERIVNKVPHGTPTPDTAPDFFTPEFEPVPEPVPELELELEAPVPVLELELLPETVSWPEISEKKNKKKKKRGGGLVESIGAWREERMALTLFERGQCIVRLEVWVRRVHGNADGDDVLVVVTCGDG